MPDVNIWPDCNNHCAMCSNPPRLRKIRKQLFALPVLLQKLDRLAESAAGPVPPLKRNALIGQALSNKERMDFFLLTGGEPTLHPQLEQLIHWIQDRFHGPRIVLLTNGRLLSDRRFAEQLTAASRNLSLVVAVHSLDPRIHDGITRSRGSLQKTLCGIENFLSLRSSLQTLEIRLVVHRMNYRQAPDTLEGLLDRFPGLDRLVVVFAEYEGRARRSLPRIALSYRQFHPVFCEICDRLGSASRIFFYHFPLCVSPPSAWDRISRTQPEEEISFPAACRGCRERPRCPGVHRQYLKLFGSREFHPVRAAEDRGRPAP